MDEQDAIPRREALAGLGILAVLSLALIVTIVSRIVRSAPVAPQTPSTPTTWASQSSPNPAVEAELRDPPHPQAEVTAGNGATAASQLPSATPIPTADAESESIPAASMTSALAPPTETPPQPSARPVFIAPAGR